MNPWEHIRFSIKLSYIVLIIIEFKDYTYLKSILHIVKNKYVLGCHEIVIVHS